MVARAGAQRLALGYRAWVRKGRRGRTGHDAPLLLAAGAPGFGFRSGELVRPGEVRLEPGSSYATFRVCAVHWTAGLDGLSHGLNDWIALESSTSRLPVRWVLNIWEAVYFDHDLAHLLELAETAAEVGVERFVLDGGWFTGRSADRRGLGDWTVSETVWPTGLNPLIERLLDFGMDFGLWVEPEMVNLDSALARAHPHPHSLLAPPTRVPSAWRHQQVLDLANPEAWAHILERLDTLLSDHVIAYLTWEHIAT